MKNVFFLVISVLSFQLSAQGIQWKSFNEAEKIAKKESKIIFIDVYTQWCGPCKMLDRNTFSDPRVVEYINKHFVAVKFNAEGNDTVVFQNQTLINEGYNPAKANSRNNTHPFSGLFAVNGRLAYPTTAYLNENLELLTPIQGYMAPAQIEPVLKYFGSKQYLTTPWEEFVQTFVAEWL